MTEQPQSKSLRDYASFELERKGYNRAQVDAFLAELDQAFIELETSVKERGDELAELQQEVERLKRESPVGRSDELLRRAELNAEQMLASSLTESQEIISNAEAIAMRIIANARAQSQEIASQPAGFGMLARVRTIAADIDRMKAEHAALMDEAPENMEMPADPMVEPGVGAVSTGAAPAADISADTLPADPASADPVSADIGAADPVSADDEAAPAAKKAAPKAVPAKKKAAAKAATAGSKKAAAASASKAVAKEPAAVVVEESIEEIVEAAPRIQLVGPQPLPKSAVAAADAEDDEDDDVIVDTKNFDWSQARANVLELDDSAPVSPLAVVDDDDEDEDADETLPTIMRRQGSRYERHSASLPKIGNEGESTLSDVAKVSRRRRRRALAQDDDKR